MLEESERTLEGVQNQDLPRSVKEMRDAAEHLKAVNQEMVAASGSLGWVVLVAVQGEASQLGTSSQGSADKQGLWDRLKSTTVDAFSEARSRLESLKMSAEKAVERIIKLMVIFVLETIVFPILFIWLLLSVFRGSIELSTLQRGFNNSKPLN